MLVHLIGVATCLSIVAFFVLFAASKAHGLVKLLGMVVGLWVLVIAVIALAAGITAPMFGGKPFGMDMHGMHDHWMHHDGDRDGGQYGPGMMGQPPATEPAPAPSDHH